MYICDVETMKVLGNQYQQQFPNENNEQKLLKLVMKDNLG